MTEINQTTSRYLDDLAAALLLLLGWAAALLLLLSSHYQAAGLGSCPWPCCQVSLGLQAQRQFEHKNCRQVRLKLYDVSASAFSISCLPECAAVVVIEKVGQLVWFE